MPDDHEGLDEDERELARIDWEEERRQEDLAEMRHAEMRHAAQREMSNVLIHLLVTQLDDDYFDMTIRVAETIKGRGE